VAGLDLCVGVLTAQIGIPLMESADVVERIERLWKRMRGMKAELEPRISNLGRGIEQIGIEILCGKTPAGDYFKMKIL
jgi:hypothetical protein